MRIERLLTGVSVASDVLGAVKVVAIGLAVLGVFGVGYAGCSKLMNAGYHRAEAERLADVAAGNAEAVERLKRSAGVVSAETRKKDARIRALTERLARTRAGTAPGAVCPKGCVLPGEKK